MLTLNIIAMILMLPLWLWIHEFSHLFVVRKQVGCLWSKMYLYPHKLNGTWYWARIQFILARPITDREQTFISLAPRIPDLFATLLAPLMFTFGLYPLGILCYGGALDLFIGSLGINPSSDLRKAADASSVSPWLLRLPGLCLSVLSLIFGLTLLL